MSTYLVRPYYAHDCDSETGFNNGYYLDRLEIVAENDGEAIAKTMELYKTDLLAQLEIHRKAMGSIV